MYVGNGVILRKLGILISNSVSNVYYSLKYIFDTFKESTVNINYYRVNSPYQVTYLGDNGMMICK